MQKGRELWVDVAKGMAILLVVIAHSVTVLGQHGLSMWTWEIVNDAFTTLRMPTFFLLSGLFAARSISAPFKQFFHSKVLSFLYLYLIWTLIHVGMAHVIPGQSSNFMESLVSAFRLNGVLWYLPALAVFFCVSRITKKLSEAVILLTATGLNVVFSLKIFESGSWGADHMAQYLLWFLIGTYFSATIRKGASRVGYMHVVIFAIIWLGGGVAVFLLGGSWLFVGNAVLPLAAVPLTIAFAVCISKWRVSTALAAIGRNTLPVYVMHFPIILLTVGMIEFVIPGTRLLIYALPMLLAFVACAIPLALTPLLKKVPGILALPKSVRLEIGTAPAPRSTTGGGC